MADGETLTLRATVIAGERCPNYCQVIWRGNERGRQLRYSKLVRNDQPSCGNLVHRWPLVSLLPAVGMGGPSSTPAPLCWGRCFSATRELNEAAN
jgi:hypothetical protein